MNKLYFTPVPESRAFQSGDEWKSFRDFRYGVSDYKIEKPRPEGRGFLTFVSFIFIVGSLFLNTKPVLSVYDPLTVPNNSFGIHIANMEDLEDSARLVNSQGGDWGYVVFVITKDELDPIRWQKEFDKMRRLHLIPTVRVATRFDGINWEIPQKEDIDQWIAFFNSLNWVIKNRYIIIGNEPNHAKEWGGKVSPEEYSDYLKIFSERLKAENSDYFILQSAFDASAPTSRETLDESIFIKRLQAKNPDIFGSIDGWASHSYPNPGFSGSEFAKGRGTIRTFEWELEFLKSLGIDKKFPVFITETGWIHKYLNEEKLAGKFKTAFETAWKDKNIVAVTPFILNYQKPPFDIFSWKNNGSFGSLYTRMQNLDKHKGSPIQDHRLEIIRISTPPFKVANSTFQGKIIVLNKGQSILNFENDLEIYDSSQAKLNVSNASFTNLEPGKSGSIFFVANTPPKDGLFETPLVIKKKGGEIISNSKNFKILVISPFKSKYHSFLNILKKFVEITKI